MIITSLKDVWNLSHSFAPSAFVHTKSSRAILVFYVCNDALTMESFHFEALKKGRTSELSLIMIIHREEKRKKMNEKAHIAFIISRDTKKSHETSFRCKQIP